MKVLDSILKGIAVSVLLLALASCCCTGGVDDNPNDTDIVGTDPHNEGVGGDA